MAKKTNDQSAELEELAKPVTFKYHDGERMRIGDASALFRKVVYCNEVPLTDPEFFEQLDNRAEPATTVAVECIARIFGLKRFDDTDGSGLSDESILSVYARFVDEMFVQKKTQGGGLKLPQRFLSECLARSMASKADGGGLESCSTASKSDAGNSSTSQNSSQQPSASNLGQRGSRQSTGQGKRRRCTTTDRVAKA